MYLNTNILYTREKVFKYKFLNTLKKNLNINEINFKKCSNT